MKHILGISAGFHDAAATVITSDGDIVFAGHSERYSKIKNDPAIHPALLEECCAWDYDTVAFYERPWMHNLQQWRSGQHLYGPWTVSAAIKKHLGQWYQHPAHKELAFSHHLSHAAAGFQTSPFSEAAVVVIDAIGELDTISIYHATYDKQGRAKYKKLWGQGYPHSIGLFYSAVTKAVGLRPMEEEYITMGMAAYGTALGAGWLKEQFVDDLSTARFKKNLHIGFDDHELIFANDADIAASAQCLAEQLIDQIMQRARSMTGSDNLVYMGGVALNCVANARVLTPHFDNVWIMPNPGDAGSSLGAAALAHGGRLNWQDAYLGYNIKGPYPVKELLDGLIADKIVGVASGRAEFGPRALGNRSLLADPRGSDIKDQVNAIKRRQKFRPFAPVILEEVVDEYFDMPRGWRDSRYMQSVATCRRPDLYPAICHYDGTSRVQTVPATGSGIRQLLEQWYLLTGCPMLLNTSLNIRGEPMVNDRADAQRFQDLYNIKVYS
jgi:carbamoyltransferase